MTKKQIHDRSTPDERRAEAIWKALQREAADNNGMMGETALLEASQAVAILIARNKRLGLIP